MSADDTTSAVPAASPTAGTAHPERTNDDGTLLRVENLTVQFAGRHRPITAVDAVSFDVRPGETVGLVGESGSGKTVSSLAILGLTARSGGLVSSGSVHFEGRDLVGLRTRELRRIRGARIGMIFQQPVRSLDPAFTVGDQIAASARRHLGLSRKAAWKLAIEMLDQVQIPKAAARVSDYPHMFSGGMCQRVMIAAALACGPVLLIADEPTTALDVTVQARILDLLRQIQAERRLAILFISHDLGVIAEMSDRVVVMYAGQVVERRQATDLFTRPVHPYTEGLLKSIPKPRTRFLHAIPGTVPPPNEEPPGCRFHPRCGYAEAGRCDTVPVDLELRPDGAVRCVRAHELHLQGTVDA